MTILIPQLLSLLCRKQAQSPSTSGQVTTAGRGRVRTQGNFGLQDPLSLNKPAWEWLTAWSLYLPICHVPFHFMSQPLVPSLVHLAALKDFLNVESLLSFCMQFDVLAYAYSLWNHLPSGESEFIYHHQKFPRAPLKLLPPGPFRVTLSSKQPPVCFLSLLSSLHLLEFPMHSCFVWLLSLRIMISEINTWTMYWWFISWNLPWIPVISPMRLWPIILWILLGC